MRSQNLSFFFLIFLFCNGLSSYFNKCNSGCLRLLFTLFLFIVGLRLLKLADFPFLIFTPLSDFVWAHENFFIMIFGFIIGLIAAWLGVGCGLLIVPFFVLIMNFNIHQAICLSLTTIFFLSTAATLSRHKLMKLELKSYKFLFFSALAGALVGSAISGILPGYLLKQTFGLILLLIACIYLCQMLLHLKIAFAVLNFSNNINKLLIILFKKNFIKMMNR